MRLIIKISIFLLIFFILWNIVFSILWLPKNNISNFYDEASNSLDIIYIGGSNVDQYFNPLLAYDMYGYTTGLLTSNSQPFIAIRSLVEESQKNQKPYLYIIDLARLQDNLQNDLSEPKIREVTDSMRFSKTKINAINKMLGYAKIDKKEYINYYFSYLMYHNSWKNLNNYVLWHDENIYKGYIFYSVTAQIVPQKEYLWNSQIIKLSDNSRQVLLELINYIKLNNIEVLFVIPKMVSFWTPYQEQLNDAISIVESNGFKIINFNTINDMNIDYNTDFYNPYHLNVYGSTKYTLYFSKYLYEHYNLPNHKDDKKYISWAESYLKFKSDFKTLTDRDFDEVLYEYNKK